METYPKFISKNRSCLDKKTKKTSEDQSPTKVSVCWVRRRRIVFTTHKGMSLHSVLN